MLTDRQQCIEVYTDVESKISITSVLGGADKLSHSVNKSLYGVFEEYLRYFHDELNAVDQKMGEDKPMRNAFNQMISEFEARERRTYATTAANQRGRFPLQFRIGNLGLKNLVGDTSWMDNNQLDMDQLKESPNWSDDEKDGVIDLTDTATKPTDSKLGKLHAITKIHRGYKTAMNSLAPKTEDGNQMSDELSDEPTALENMQRKNLTPREKKVIRKVKDIYHDAMEALLDVCDESLVGLTVVTELYELMRSGNQLTPYDYKQLRPRIENESDADYARAMIRAAENLKRSITQRYFKVEIEDRMKMAKSKEANDIDVSELRTKYFKTPTAILQQLNKMN